MHWYALKIFFKRTAALLSDLNADGIETFVPSDVIPSLMFVYCEEHYILDFCSKHWQQAWVYRNMDNKKIPAIIPDHEMEVFRFVVTAGRQGLTVLGDDNPKYHEGDRVVVIDGPFKGAEGHIHRIKRDRRVVVAVNGVVAVALTYIHPSMLQKIDKEDEKVIGWGRV